MLSLKKSIWPVSMAQSKEKNSLILMVLTFLSRILGIVKARFISSFFGAGLVADAINFSYNIPNNLRKLFAEGALSQAYLPIFAKLKDDDKNTSLFLSQVFTLQIIIFIPLIILCFVFNQNFIALTSGFTDSYQITIASNLLPFFLIFLFLISISTLFSTVLQIKQSFFVTGLGPIIFTLSVIVSIKFFTGKFFYYSMAIGSVAGALLQMLSQYIVVRKNNVKVTIKNPLKGEYTKLMTKAFLPATLYSLIMVVDQYISFYLASTLERGAVSAITNSIIFYQTPYGIFFSSISSVFFPLLSSEKDNEKKINYLSTALSYLFLLLLPSAIILLTLSKECISAVLQKGEFTYIDTINTSKVLKWYLFSMIPLAFSSMLSRYCYSKGDYRYPVIVSLTQAILDVFFMILFIKLDFGAESISLALLSSVIISLTLYITKLKGLKVLKLSKELLRSFIANIPLIISCLSLKLLNLNYYQMGSNVKTFLITALIGVGLLIITLCSYILFKVPFLTLLKRKGPNN